MKHTKIEALMYQVHTGKIKTDAARILNYIKNNPNSTELDIVAGLGILNKTVAARLVDLEDMGIIYGNTIKQQRGHGRFAFIYVNDVDARATLSASRKYVKAITWLKSGLKNHANNLSDDMISQINKELNRLIPF